MTSIKTSTVDINNVNKTRSADGKLDSIYKKPTSKSAAYTKLVTAKKKGAELGSNQQPIVVLRGEKRTLKTGKEKVNVKCVLLNPYELDIIHVDGITNLEVFGRTVEKVNGYLRKEFAIFQDVKGNAYLLFKDRTVGTLGKKSGNLTGKVSFNKTQASCEVSTLAPHYGLLLDVSSLKKTPKEVVYQIDLSPENYVTFTAAINKHGKVVEGATMAGYKLTKMNIDVPITEEVEYEIPEVEEVADEEVETAW